MVDFQTFLLTAGSSTMLSGLFLFYLQERTKSDFAKKLEETRASLREQTDIKLLKMKSELDAAATERSLRFSKTYERTSEVIATLYRQILELRWAINEFAEPFAPFGSSSAENQKEFAGEWKKRMQRFSNHSCQTRFSCRRRLPKGWKTFIRISFCSFNVIRRS
jgi:hypothetical protein